MSWLPYPDTVQHVSLPLSLLGLFLAMMEIYFPRHARYLESRVDAFALNPFPKDLHESLVREAGKGRVMLLLVVVIITGAISMAVHYGFAMLVSKYGFIVSVPALALIVLALGIAALGPQKTGRVLMICLGLGMAMEIIVFYALLLLCTAASKYPFVWMDRVGKGHAIGGIGLSLGTIGFLGEVYQVVMMDRDVDVKTSAQISAIYVTVFIAFGVVAFFVHRIVKRESKE